MAKIILLWDLVIFHSHDPLWRCTQISKEAKTNKVMVKCEFSQIP